MPNYRPTEPVCPALAWLIAVLSGVVGPVAALVWFSNDVSFETIAAGVPPILAIGVMASGMIAGAADGRLWVGLAVSAVVGLALIALSVALLGLGIAFAIGAAVVVAGASVSFAARGALFARSGGSKGWFIALFVVAGEAAIVLTALARPDALPAWLLALLPARWASIAFGVAITGFGITVAWAPLVALLGTAAATLFVVQQWPKRWTYAVMFTTWLAMSALVYRVHGTTL